MNFTIFVCVTLKLFFLSFMTLLASNPGDAAANGKNQNLHISNILLANEERTNWLPPKR